MTEEQLSLPIINEPRPDFCEAEFDATESSAFDFHSENVTYASHNFHAFPAKFPPQLPKHFIQTLTKPGEVVLDPMQGSGTTVLEAVITQRNVIGIDIDPLAVLISKVKTTPLDPFIVYHRGREVINNAKEQFFGNPGAIEDALGTKWDKETKDFIDYWFAHETQLELMALLLEIENIEDLSLRRFFQLAFSATIVTKTGGVSLALDLAHTRPHRAKLIYQPNGEILEGAKFLKKPVKNLNYATKRLRSPFIEFSRRVEGNLKGVLTGKNYPCAQISFANAENLPVSAETIDLIVTSPPYASNAIDYMRAHKFSLVWFGYPLSVLSKKRSTYIGGEMTTDIFFEDLPDFSSQVIAEISAKNNKKGLVVKRYYSEMKRVLSEMFRVLRPGKAAVVVVGNSTIEGCSTETHLCLAEIGRTIGFSTPKIISRKLDRNRRMMPTGKNVDDQSQIQQRMHKEFILEFQKKR